ncbi:MAG: hypothetical protein P1S46_05115 [bacterium]|nr:hypothetical protein [bacterium]MDT8395106.1 hypothetical protein [bacterium]
MKGNRPGGVPREVVSRLLEADANTREEAVQVVCRGFCEYFKGDGGEPECGGFNAVKNGIDSGCVDPSHLEQLVDRKPHRARKSRFLVENLCAGCGYLAEGCDYLSELPTPGATPCGGYRFLQALLECEALTEEQIRDMVENTERRINPSNKQ